MTASYGSPSRGGGYFRPPTSMFSARGQRMWQAPRRNFGGALLAAAGAGYGMFVANNLRKQSKAIDDPSESVGDGRLGAVQYLSQFPQGTAGHAMALPVGAFHALAGDIGSSTIGRHYREDIPDKIKGPDTDENLEAIGEHETEKFWKVQSGLPKVMGGAITAEQRTRILKSSRNLQRFWSSGKS